MIQRLNWIIATERRRTALTIFVWTIAIACTFAQALYQRAYLTIFDYGLVAAICLIAGAVISDFATAIISFVFAMFAALALLFFILTVPASAADAAYALWIIVIFTSTFPFPFIAFMISTIIGAGLSEKYFY